MPNSPGLQPTLWRTCRVLANHTRLQVLELLVRETALHVTTVAERLKLTVPVASQALRSLEARGMLTARRHRRRVEYRVGALTNPDNTPTLLGALRPMLRKSSAARDNIFRIATAFTHPSRIALYRLIEANPHGAMEMPPAVGLSPRAFFRHLRKLETRGFIGQSAGKYIAVNHTEALGRTLARLAVGP